MQIDSAGKMQRGEVVVFEANMAVLCSEDVLRSVLAMAQIVKEPSDKKK